MSLSSDSNTINALGIFGRMGREQEGYFRELEEKYSRRPENDPANGIFNHLSLVINRDVPVGEVPKYLDLLKELKHHLPFRLAVDEVIEREEKHLALAFDTGQTEGIRELAGQFFDDGVVTTFYTKVVWFVPQENRKVVMDELRKVKEMVFEDFVLVANRQNDGNMIYRASKF